MMGNANEKTQSSKVKARQCSLIKERASLLILPDDLYVALNQCEVEYKLVLSVTLLSDLRNETVTNLVSLLTNDIQSFQGTTKRCFRISLPNSVKSNTSKTGWSEGSLQISSPLLSQYCSQVVLGKLCLPIPMELPCLENGSWQYSAWGFRVIRVPEDHELQGQLLTFWNLEITAELGSV